MDLESVLVFSFLRFCLVEDDKYCREEATVMQVADQEIIKYWYKPFPCSRTQRALLLSVDLWICGSQSVHLTSPWIDIVGSTSCQYLTDVA